MTFTVARANLPDWRRVWPLKPPSDADRRVTVGSAGTFRSRQGGPESALGHIWVPNSNSRVTFWLGACKHQRGQIQLIGGESRDRHPWPCSAC